MSAARERGQQTRLHAALVEVGDLFAEFGARELGVVLQLCGDVAHGEVLALARLVVDDALHLEQIDDALEVLFLADGKLDGRGIRLELRAHLLHDAVEVRAHAVHLVHERDARHVIAVSLAPHRLALRLDAAHGAEHAHGTVEDAQRAFDLHREVHVAGGVDDVDRPILPVAGDCGGLNGDATLLLLDHEVRRRVAFVDFTGLVDLAGVEEDALGRRGLARVDVGDDADVAYVCKRAV